jgi:hypothetical protein
MVRTCVLVLFIVRALCMTLGQILDEDLGMHGEAAWVAVSVTCCC